MTAMIMSIPIMMMTVILLTTSLWMTPGQAWSTSPWRWRCAASPTPSSPCCSRPSRHRYTSCSFRTWSVLPSHLGTLTPGHLVTIMPGHLVTIMPGHLVTWPPGRGPAEGAAARLLLHDVLDDARPRASGEGVQHRGRGRGVGVGALRPVRVESLANCPTGW